MQGEGGEKTLVCHPQNTRRSSTAVLLVCQRQPHRQTLHELTAGGGLWKRENTLWACGEARSPIAFQSLLLQVIFGWEGWQHPCCPLPSAPCRIGPTVFAIVFAVFANQGHHSQIVTAPWVSPASPVEMSSSGTKALFLDLPSRYFVLP